MNWEIIQYPWCVLFVIYIMAVLFPSVHVTSLLGFIFYSQDSFSELANNNNEMAEW